MEKFLFQFMTFVQGTYNSQWCILLYFCIENIGHAGQSADVQFTICYNEHVKIAEIG